MQFVLKMDVDNDAFADDLAGEVARTLTAMAKRIHREGCSFDEPMIVRDVNGNRIGRAEFDDAGISSDENDKFISRHVHAPQSVRTDRDVRTAIHALGMNVTKRDGEYRINWPGADEDQAYYTDDRQDALDTARAMAKRGDRSRRR